MSFMAGGSCMGPPFFVRVLFGLYWPTNHNDPERGIAIGYESWRLARLDSYLLPKPGSPDRSGPVATSHDKPGGGSAPPRLCRVKIRLRWMAKLAIKRADSASGLARIVFMWKRVVR